MSDDSASDSDIDLDEIGPTRTLLSPRKVSSCSTGTIEACSPSVSIASLDLDDIRLPIVSDKLQNEPHDLEIRKVSSCRDDSRSTALRTANTPTAPVDVTASSSRRPPIKSKKIKLPTEPDAWLFPPDYADIDFSDDERLDRVERRPQFTEIFPQRVATEIYLPASKGVIPASIAQWLRNYQVHGAAFLHKLFAQQVGGILGDDMGLGKTVQVIAFLTAAFGKTGDGRDGKRRRKMRNYTDQWYPRILLVCPGVLIENWREELNRWGWWDMGVFHGSAISKEEALKSARLGYIEIMITTYSTYLTHKSEVNTIDWDCVIADECHCLKGKRAQITEAMNEVNARCRIGLTGTAIQNNYNELWSLLNWVNPNKLGSSKDWSSAVTEPLKRGQSHDATLIQLGKARRIARSLVQNLLPRFFLRRTKALIADQLPRKYDRVVFCPLTKTQAEAYKTFLACDMVQSIKRATESCDCSSGLNRGWCCHAIVPGFEDKWQSFVFPIILTLSKLSNHVALLLPQADHDKDKQLRQLDLFKLALPEDWSYYYRRLDMDNFTDIELFGKWKILRKLLAFWEPKGNKVLVFSHSTRLLEILRVLFTSTSYTVCYLDGKMSLPARAAEVTKFNSSPDQFIFCISTKAGGVGLNITSANKVIIMDPNWNPAYDLQAQDRAYRIGQRRDVEVFRLVSGGTIEEAIYARQIYKQQQAAIAYTASNERRHFRGVLGSSEKGDIFGLENLLSFSEDLKLKDILDKTEIAETRAGVRIASINVDVPEGDIDADEDSTISQFANAISRGKAAEVRTRNQAESQADPVQAILSQAGISYTHDNKETLGSSRVESELSAQAQAKGMDSKRSLQKAFNDDSHIQNDYKWHPVEIIRKRQFETMAREHGEETEAFAVRVENWAAEERRNFLDDFYNHRQHLRRKKTKHEDPQA